MHNSGAPHAGLQQLAGLQLQANGKEQECDADIRKTMENLSAHQLEFVQREAGCEVADKCRQAKGSTAESEDQGDQDNQGVQHVLSVSYVRYWHCVAP